MSSLMTSTWKYLFSSFQISFQNAVSHFKALFMCLQNSKFETT
jgi:hypothetical protein